MINLDALSLPELLEIQKQIRLLIAQRQDEVHADVLQKATQLAAKHGLTLEDLVRKGRKRYGPRYTNPEDFMQTWSGVGSRPKWVREWLAAGKTLEDLTKINEETP